MLYGFLLQLKTKIKYYMQICDPAPLNEALWGKYQKWERYCITISTIFYTFWCKNDYSVIFLSKVTEHWTSPCISFNTTLQRFRLSKIVTSVYFYGLIKTQMFHNTSFLPNLYWKRYLSWLCLVCWIFRKNISQMKNFDLVSYFCL